jgi:hypothetical protein
MSQCGHRACCLYPDVLLCVMDIQKDASCRFANRRYACCRLLDRTRLAISGIIAKRNAAICTEQINKIYTTRKEMSVMHTSHRTLISQGA